MVPVTGLGEAAAGTATVGGLGGGNVAVPLTVPVAGGNRCVGDRRAWRSQQAGGGDRAGVVVQVNVGDTTPCRTGLSAVAVYCSVLPAFKLAEGGLTVIAVSVWLTVTLTVLVAVKPLGSVIVTWKL